MSLIGEAGCVCRLSKWSAFHHQPSGFAQAKDAQVLANITALRAPEHPGQVNGMHSCL